MEWSQAVSASTDGQMVNQPIEYCFLWIDWWVVCMTKSEWAGWVQAVGSVLALVGAFLVVKLQYAKQVHLQKISAISRIRNFVATTSSHLERLVAVSALSTADVKLLHAVVCEQLAIAATIQAEYLHISWSAALEGTRSVSAQTKVLCEILIQSPEKNTEIISTAKLLQGALEDFVQTVRVKHPGVTMYKI